MSLFGNSIGQMMINDEEDVFKAKEVLSEIGLYEREPDNGILDQELDSALKIFQKDQGLKIDGILYPNGETEDALTQNFAQKQDQKETLEKHRPQAQRKSPLEMLLGNLDALEEAPERIFRAVEEKKTPHSKEKPESVDATGRMIRDKLPSVPERKPVAPRGSKNNDKGHTIDTFFPKLSSEEGAFTEGVNDRRGRTNIGINKGILDEYKDWKESKGEKLPDTYTQNVKKVSPELARRIYDEMYYKRYNIDKIKDTGMASHLLDISINQGSNKAGRWLQEELNDKSGANIKVDGIMGSETRDMIKKAKEDGVLDDVHNGIVKRRKQHYRKISENDSSQKDFLKGWLDRADRFSK